MEYSVFRYIQKSVNMTERVLGPSEAKQTFGSRRVIISYVFADAVAGPSTQENVGQYVHSSIALEALPKRFDVYALF